MTAAPPLLKLNSVSKRFSHSPGLAGDLARLLGAKVRTSTVHAVDGVDLAISGGEVVGLVGESGCGKSTLGRLAAGIQQPTEGTIQFAGKNVADLSARERRAADLSVQMVFQDTMASLNPRRRVVDLIGEAPLVHGIVPRTDLDAYVCRMLDQVGLDPAVRQRYPHQFSGGQRTRISIARALAVRPKIIVCDEATASLDVSVQAQVLNLFAKLRDELKLSYLFVSHDLGVVQHIADRIAVMYLGRIIEMAPAEALFEAPNHPYTRGLLDEIPRLEAKKKLFASLQGELPSPLAPPPGCHFHPRCPFAMARCAIERPVLKQIGPQRMSACHLNDGPNEGTNAPPLFRRLPQSS